MNGAIERWRQDPSFLEVSRSIEGRTLIDPDRQYMIYQLATKVSREVGGQVAEVGVYKGGSAKILLDRFPDRPIYLFDTFEGMPKPIEGVDLHREKDFADTNERDVWTFLKAKNVTIIAGRFPETVRGRWLDGPFCFVHADADIYESTINICQFFVPRMVRGGMILFDDYGFETCPGAKKAVDEFFTPEGVIYLPTGQALYVH